MIKASLVEKIFTECLYKDNEIGEDGKPIILPIVVDGIINKFGLHPERIEIYKNEIIEILEQLPDPFRKSSGGGWSFLNACEDKEGNQWGEHRHMEQLFCLGIAIDKVEYQLPREMWSALPGGVPYIVYNDV